VRLFAYQKENQKVYESPRRENSSSIISKLKKLHVGSTIFYLPLYTAKYDRETYVLINYAAKI